MLSILRYQNGRHWGLATRAILIAAATLCGLILPRVVRRLPLLLLGEEVTRAERAIHVDLVRAGVQMLLLLLNLWAVLVMGMVQLLSSGWTVIAVSMQEGAIVLLMLMVTG